MISSPRAALGLLLGINVLNYVDRQVLYAVLPLIKVDLVLSDTELGALASAFMLVYMLAAPAIAVLVDRIGRRTAWLAGGVLVWSGATALAGFCSAYRPLFLSRAAVGIGEASFGSLSPSFVVECFPAHWRGRAMAVFSMAIPVGSALGYVFGGFVGQHLGWRSAFLWAGAVGIPLGLIALRLKDPRESRHPAGPGGPPQDDAWKTYLNLLKNKSFRYSCLAMTAATFTLGGLAVWMPTYFHREWGLSVAQAGMIFGGLTVLSGIAGSLAGGWLADHFLKQTKSAYFLVSGLGLALSLPFGALALLSPSLPVALAALGTAEFLVFLNTGPLNAAIAAVTPLTARTMAFALNILVIHALGDALSPILIGRISDAAGLKIALLGSLGFLLLGAFFCFRGMRSYKEIS